MSFKWNAKASKEKKPWWTWKAASRAVSSCRERVEKKNRNRGTRIERGGGGESVRTETIDRANIEGTERDSEKERKPKRKKHQEQKRERIQIGQLTAALAHALRMPFPTLTLSIFDIIFFLSISSVS